LPPPARGLALNSLTVAIATSSFREIQGVERGGRTSAGPRLTGLIAVQQREYKESEGA
jgi:hypothetical protein